MSSSSQWETKTKAAANAGDETAAIQHRGYTTFSAVDPNGTYAGKVILWRSLDAGVSWQNVWQQTQVAADLAIYKTIATAEPNVMYKVEMDTITAGTALNLTISSAYKPGV